MGSGASTKVDLSSIENLQREFETHGDDTIRLAWELTAKQFFTPMESIVRGLEKKGIELRLTRSFFSTRKFSKLFRLSNNQLSRRQATQ